METENIVHSDSRTQIRREPYLGSVRFFKHMILTILALMILVPTVLCIVFGLKGAGLKKELAQLREELLEERKAAAEREAEFEKALAELQNLAAKSDLPTVSDEPSPPEWDQTAQEYQLLYPDMYIEDDGRAPISQDKTVYLTFDDGPTERTAEILDILNEYGVKATFFVIGHENERSIELMQRIVNEGHTLGIHSYSHNYQAIYASVEDYLADFNRLYELIEEQVGIQPQIFRFPGGSINGYNSNIWRQLVVEMVRRGFVYFDWNVSSDDAAGAKPLSADAIVSNCLSDVSQLNRAVILMHDSAYKRTTVEALPRIIEGYRAAGFTFAALTAEVKPIVYSYPK